MFVEGKDEKDLFQQLLRALNIANVQIHDVRGKENIARRLRLLRNDTNFDFVTSIGVVRDADDNPAAARQSVENSLARANLPRPGATNDQVSSPDGLPKTSVFILPDNQSAGSLESLLLQAAENDPAMACIHTYFACLGQAGVLAGYNWPKAQQDKARVLAFFASRRRLPAQIGVAARQSAFDWGNPVFDQLKAFLRTF